MFDRIQTTPAAEKLKRDVLEEMKERIGPDRFKEIMTALVHDNVESLPSDLQEIVDELKQYYRPTHH